MLKNVEKLLSKVMGGTSTDRELKRVWPMVAEINEIAEGYKKLTDDELKSKTNEFKYRLRMGETLDDILPEAYAVVKDTCRRLLGKKWMVRGQEIEWDMVPYDVQIVGGIVLHEGKIAEMATGEGKTLVATMPLYLNALDGKGAHLITVNDYLAQRDCEWMGEIYKFLGLSIAPIFGDQSPEERRLAYQADISYGTNNEFGFDYLRDNMASDVWSVVQRPLNYAIVDEVDSVLIDEARTPLIISGAVGAPKNIYKELKPTVENLYKRQKELVQQLIREGKELFEKDEELAGIKILRAQRGDPKNPALLELLTSEFWIKKLIERIQGQYEVNKNMSEIDAELYYTIDEKSHVIDITEKGRIFLSGGRDQDIVDKIQKLDELDEILLKISGQKNRAVFFNHDPINGYCNGLTREGKTVLAKIKNKVSQEQLQAIDALSEQFLKLSEEVNSRVQNKKGDKASVWRSFYAMAKKMDRAINELTEEGKKYLSANGEGKYSEKEVDAFVKLLGVVKDQADVDNDVAISRLLIDRRRNLIQTFFETDKHFGIPLGIHEEGKIALLAILHDGDPLLVPVIFKLENLLKDGDGESESGQVGDQKQEYFEFKDNGAVLNHISEKGRIALLGGNPDLYVLPDRSIVEERDQQMQKLLDDTLNQATFDYTARVIAVEQTEQDLSAIDEYIASRVSENEKVMDIFYDTADSPAQIKITETGLNHISNFAGQSRSLVSDLDGDLTEYMNNKEQIFQLGQNGEIHKLADEELDRLLGSSYKDVEREIANWQQSNQNLQTKNVIALRLELDKYLGSKIEKNGQPGPGSISRRFEDVKRISLNLQRVFAKVADKELSFNEKQRWLRRYFRLDGEILPAAELTKNIVIKGLSETGKNNLIGLAKERDKVANKLLDIVADQDIDVDAIFVLRKQGYPGALEKTARSLLLDGLPFFSFNEEFQKFRDEIIQLSTKKVNSKSEFEGLLPKEKAHLRLKNIMLDDREMTELLSNAHLPHFVMSNEEIEHWFRIHFDRKPRAILEGKRDKFWQDYNRVEERVQNISQLLRAYTLYQKDVDYVVKAVEEGETRRSGAQAGRKAVMIVDQFTGRLMPGRRFSEGLHEALEAKESVEVQAESQTLATITLQNFFRLYNKLAGMTGTAETEAQEFFSTYKIDVIVIPTNKPVVRDDANAVIYRTRKEKYQAIIDETIKMHEQGRPVLIGTISVDVSQHLSHLFTLRGIPVANWLKKGDVAKELESGRFHTVLNAKYHKMEAEIVAKAGLPGAITIATNMAGRGTDIKLSKDVIERGGLHIIGSEKHEARRIDRQLSGRSGRQGDPGSSRFYLSLEDDLMRLFGSDRITSVMSRLGSMEENERIEHPLITRSIERAQKKVEERNFEIRKNLLEYDDVLNDQRKIIYKRRQNLLGFAQPEDFVESKLKRFLGEMDDKSTWKLPELLDNVKEFFGTEPDFNEEDLERQKSDNIRDFVLQWVDERLKEQRHLYQMQERHRILGYCHIQDVLVELVLFKIRLHNAGTTDVSRWNMEGISFELDRILGASPEWLQNKSEMTDAAHVEQRIVDWALDIYNDKVQKYSGIFNKIMLSVLSLSEFMQIYVNGLMNRHLSQDTPPGTWNTEAFLNELEKIFMDRPPIGENEMRTIRREKIAEKIQQWLNELSIDGKDDLLYRNRVFGYFSATQFINAIIEYLFIESVDTLDRDHPEFTKKQKDFLEKVFEEKFEFDSQAKDWNALINQTIRHARQLYLTDLQNNIAAYNELMLANTSIEELIEASILALFKNITTVKNEPAKTQKLLSQNLENMFLSKPDKTLPESRDTNSMSLYREELVSWGLNFYKTYSDRVERYHQERLSSEIVFDSVLMMIDDTVYAMISNVLGNDDSLGATQIRRLESDCRLVFRQSPRLRDENDEVMDPNDVMDKVSEWAKGIYKKRVNEIGKNMVARYERYYILEKIDENWRQHLSGVDDLREGIGLRGYGQKDPLLEYKSEAYKMFVKTVDSINRDVVSTLFRVFDVGGEFEEREMRRAEPQQLSTSHSQVELFKQVMTKSKQKPDRVPGPGGGGVKKPVVKTVKVGRNDPCPCGSGKKYKNCCGKNV